MDIAKEIGKLRVLVDRQFEMENELIEECIQSQADADSRLELLIRAMNALEGWRILLEFPVTDIMRDIEEELEDEK